MKAIATIVLLLASFASRATDTPPLDFVKEYVRELVVLEGLREEGEAELKERSADNVQPFIVGIHSFTRIQNALETNLHILSSMHLAPTNETDIETLTQTYQLEIIIYKRMIEVSTAILSGPKPNTDYGSLIAEMPKLRAGLDDADESLFKIANLVFATLIDMHPDKNGHASHLIITCEERQALIGQLNNAFGAKLDSKGAQGYLVSGAWLLRDNLKKGFKCSNEPW